MIKKILTIFLLAFATQVAAHEFWLEPQKFIYKWGDTVNLRFMVGENFTGENWKGNKEKVQRLSFYYDGVVDSSLYDDVSDEKGDSLQISLLDEGTGMIAFQSTNSFIELEAAKFNQYLQEDGLTETLNYRKEHNLTDSTGREQYQRNVKTIFQVGGKEDKSCTQPTFLPLDIIPEKNPYDVKNKKEFKIKLLFNREPLTNQLVKVWHKTNNLVTQQNYTTDEKGYIQFEHTDDGIWMVSTVKMIPVSSSNADWQSYWGSLTWGFTR